MGGEFLPADSMILRRSLREKWKVPRPPELALATVTWRNGVEGEGISYLSVSDT
jgi:hypothetical protein